MRPPTKARSDRGQKGASDVAAAAAEDRGTGTEKAERRRRRGRRGRECVAMERSERDRSERRGRSGKKVPFLFPSFVAGLGALPRRYLSFVGRIFCPFILYFSSF